MMVDIAGAPRAMPIDANNREYNCFIQLYDPSKGHGS